MQVGYTEADLDLAGYPEIVRSTLTKLINEKHYSQPLTNLCSELEARLGFEPHGLEPMKVFIEALTGPLVARRDRGDGLPPRKRRRN